ncbi:hypothetical protein [Burkholderia pseudomallei]|uniref:hypothetical protein n=1 Tax=Burkholderia pseudomallei TaxID=28450 RepID=UPI0016050BD4|nr:hypothetical protein [Burkholderia pseudomallei]
MNKKPSKFSPEVSGYTSINAVVKASVVAWGSLARAPVSVKVGSMASPGVLSNAARCGAILLQQQCQRADLSSPS